MDSVELGFVKKTASWKLRSKFFPSKVGGKPAWLALKNLPDPADLSCNFCGKPYVFLVQVYANIDENTDAFHRTIYVFMCSNGKCIKRFSNDGFLVLRSQLPRKNDFFSFEPPVFDEKLSNESSAENFQPLCNACGCKAILCCEKCSKVNYCSDFHRQEDWKSGHQELCNSVSDTRTQKKKKTFNSCTLPEFEIECDTEYLPEEKEKSEEEKMKEYREFMKSSKAPTELQDVPLDDLESVAKRSDKAFNKFRKRIQHNPEQILRYQRGGTPLLVSLECVPKEADIPPCVCGSKRTFEFQIMSQLLLHLSLDSVSDSPDWGTLLIYTCAKSCSAGTSDYVKEFLWKQDFSNE